VEQKIALLKEKEEYFEKNHQLVEHFTKRKVKLDVGGKLFSVSLQTLTKEEPSFFSAMFSGRFKLEKDEEDGSYFIDRNPLYFEVILDYLRTGVINFKKYNSEELAELKMEIEFYQILSLLNIFSQSITQFDPLKSTGYILSNNNTTAEFNKGGFWSIAIGDGCFSTGGCSFEFHVLHCSGHNDRIGFIEHSELQNLNKQLTTFAIYLQNSPGINSFCICSETIVAISPLSKQVKVGDRVGFVFDFNASHVMIFLNGEQNAKYSFQPNCKFYAAFGTQNQSSKVQLTEYKLLNN